MNFSEITNGLKKIQDSVREKKVRVMKKQVLRKKGGILLETLKKKITEFYKRIGD